ncbi:hypothetical protein BDR22DRAFT_829423 [Usnea florida]
MSISDYDPISRPNSAFDELPGCQLQLVNRGLKINPHRREDYYRQFSVTPERQTPESQRTPDWPRPDPEEFREVTDAAWEAAKSFKRFYKGRVLFREDPDASMICGYTTAYWQSKTKEWLNEVQRLEEQYEQRLDQEKKGGAHRGYAEALLRSPPPSPPAADGISRTPTPMTKEGDPAVSGASLNSTAKLSPQTHRISPYLQQLTPNDSSETVREVASGRKRSHGRSRRCDEHGKSLNQIQSKKRQQRVKRGPKQTHESDPVPMSGRQIRTKNWKISKANAKEASQRKKLSSVASRTPRSLPWNLRSKNAVSYYQSITKSKVVNGVISKRGY